MSKRKRASEPSAGEARSKKHRAVSPESLEESSQADGSNSVVHANAQLDHVERGTQPDSNAAQESGWTLRPPVGGRILDLDPLFTADDQFFLVAYAAKVKVFSCATGLCTRSLGTQAKGTIVAFGLSQTDPSRLYIGVSSGRIEIWDWSEGERIAKWDTGAKLASLYIARGQDGDQVEDLVYVVENAKGKWNVTAHRLHLDGSKDSNEARTLLSRDDTIESLYVTENSRIAVVHAGKKILVGSKRGAKTFPLQSLRYTWREFECSDHVASISAHVSGGDERGVAPTVDLAVGTFKGVIFIYRDILNALTQAQQMQKPALPAFKYHWHRNAVSSLVWSKDGSYVLSGGFESVLVLWQLDTNDKSFLPHLAAAIRNVAVSSTGTQYGLVLGDNSSLVLNALDLKPVLRISEPQIGFQGNGSAVSHSSRLVRGIATHRRLPLDVVRSSSKIMTASPAYDNSQNSVRQSSASPFLQVLDYKSGRELFRQALTRTKVTDRNVGPQGNILEEPDVVLMAVNTSGNWLATVDEWLSPAKDRGRFGPDMDSDDQASLDCFESYLKFWQWGNSSQRWELAWRVELSSNVTKQNGKRAVILDLVADKSRPRFYTLDGGLRIRAWEPQKRVRHGKQVRDQRQNDLSNWVSHDIAALDSALAWPDAPLSAKMTTSQCGSLLVAALSSGGNSSISLFDLNGHKLVSFQSGLIHGPVLGLALVAESLVVLSEDVLIWDVVRSHWTHILDNSSNTDTRKRKWPKNMQYKHMVLDEWHQTVAIAIPVSEHKSRIAFIRPQDQTVGSVIEVPSLVRALLPSPNKGGIVCLNENSEIQTIAGPGIAIDVRESSPADLPGERLIGLEAIFGAPSRGAGSVETKAVDGGVMQIEGAKSKDAQLTEVLGKNQPLAMPSMMSMFKQVASIFARQR